MAHISLYVLFSALDIGRCSRNESMQNSRGVLYNHPLWETWVIVST